MTKKETIKWIVQLVASIATAILTALGATSCLGFQTKKAVNRLPSFNIITELIVTAYCAVVAIAYLLA